MTKTEKSSFFPILINLQNFPCLVIGGGKVALRKVITLQSFNAKITVLAPKICKPLRELSNKKVIKITQQNYNKKYLRNFKLVFCATDNPKINRAVHEDCKEKNILLNVADVPSLCDFILPAVVKRGDLTISVSSQGRAPFFAKEIKNKIDKLFSETYKDILELAGNFRSALLNDKKYKSSKIKEKAFRKFSKVDWIKIIDNEGKKKANENMLNIFKEL